MSVTNQCAMTAYCEHKQHCTSYDNAEQHQLHILTYVSVHNN